MLSNNMADDIAPLNADSRIQQFQKNRFFFGSNFYTIGVTEVDHC